MRRECVILISPRFLAPIHYRMSNPLSPQNSYVELTLDTLQTAIEKNATKMMRLLSRLSFLLFLQYLLRFRNASQPWQKTRYRLVICGDDLLLVHAEQSE